MRFTLSGIEPNGEVSTFFVKVDQVYSCLQLTGRTEKTLKREDLHEYLSEYVNGYYLHIEYDDRKFCKLFYSELDTEVKRSLVRTFAISTAFLDKLSDFVLNREEYILETLGKYFMSQLMTDWTANQYSGDVQPQLYFINKEMGETRQSELIELYQIGLLQKFSFQGEKKFSNYYLPALRRDDTQINALKPPKIWNEIVVEMNSAIEKFVGGFRKFT